MAKQQSKSYVVSGRITSPTDQPVEGLIVRAFDVDPTTPEDQLGQPAVTDSDGGYSIAFTDKDFAGSAVEKGPDVLIRVYNGLQLIGQSKVNHNSLEKIIIDLQVDASVTGPNDSRKVFGIVSNELGLPLNNLKVLVFNQNFRSEQLLAETVTNKEGKYEITWLHSQLRGREKGTPDILIKVFTRKDTLVFISGIDSIRFNASEREEINITIKQAIPKEEVEFDLLVKEILFLTDPLVIADLEENEEHLDVSFLSKELEIPAAKIEHLVVAHRLEDSSKINAAFFYALFRKNTLLHNSFLNNLNARLSIGIGADDKTLLYDATLTDSATIEADIKKAVDEKIVSPAEIKNSGANLEILSRYKKEAADYYEKEHPEKAFDLLANFFEENKLQEIQELFNEHKNDLPAFFDKITDPSFYTSKKKTKDSVTTVEPGKFFGLGKEIIPEIIKSKGIKNPGDTRQLAKLNKAGWVAEITRARPDIQDKQLISTYASAMVRKMEKEFPTLAFAAQLERAKEPVLKYQDKIVSFFSRHEDFDLTKHNVDLYLKEKEIIEPGNETINEELKSVQRIFKLVPNYSKTLALRNERIHSSLNIVATGETRFVNEVAPKAGIHEKEAKAIYRKAEAKHTAAMLMVGNLQDSMSVMDIASFETSALAKKLEVVSKDFPNLKSLFKLTDTCECEHCRSVYSPAAYLVEILQFLDKRMVVANNAKCVLFKRRPELGEIDLGCANANTPVKYIDLVCEILEEAIAPDQGIDFNGLLYTEPEPNKRVITEELKNTLTAKDLPVTSNAQIFGTENQTGIVAPYYLRDTKLVCKIVNTGGGGYKIYRLRQTLSTAEELDAAPEYSNKEAYDELKDKAFAFKLPFDVDHIEATAYLSRFNVNRADLMKAFQRNGTPPDRSIAAERLGLTDLERKIIVAAPVTNDNAAQQVFWNVPAPGNVVDHLKQVDHFLERTGLTYKELDLLLKLKFIDKNGNLFISHNFDDLLPGQDPSTRTISCNTAKKEIAHLDLDTLDRIQRFLRLQKKTGWKYEVLNEMISQGNLGAGNLNDACLIKAAKLKEISDKANIKIEDLNGCFGEFPYLILQEEGPKPLYHQVFLNKAKNGTIDDNLLVESVLSNEEGINNPATKPPGWVPKKLVELKTSLSNCLQVKESELFNDDYTILPPAADLTFSNLSYLYSASRLIKKFNLKTEDFAVIHRLSGINFSAGPVETLAFIKVIQDFKASPVKATDVRYILNHQANDLGNREIKTEKIEELLGKLNTEYTKINEQQKSKYDEKLSADEQKETLQSELAKLIGIGEDDIKKIISFVNRDWSQASDAKTIITNKLNAVFTDAEIATINNKLDVLELPPHNDFINERNDLVVTFINLIDPSVDLSGLSFGEKKTILKRLLSNLTALNNEDVDLLIKFIERISVDEAVIYTNRKLGFEDEALTISRVGFELAQIKAEIINLWSADKVQDVLKHENALLALKTAQESVDAAITPDELAAATVALAAAKVQLLITVPLYHLATGRNLLKAFLDSISKGNIQTEKLNILYQTISTSFKTDPDLIKVVLRYAKLKQPFSGVPPSPGTELIAQLLLRDILPVNYPIKADAMKLLHKILAMLNAFKLSNTEIEWYFKNTSNLSWFQFDSIPYATGQTNINFYRYLAFIKIIGYAKQFTTVTNPLDVEKPLSFFTIADMMLLPAGTANRGEFLNTLALVTGYEKTDLDAIDAHFFSTFNITNYRDPEIWEWVFACADLVRKLGAGVGQIKKYINPTLTASEVNDLRATLKSRYDEDTWLSTLKEIMDAIRPQKRNALVAYLLAANPAIKNANDLYEYFLVDVEMGACMQSSRIVLAHNSVQLFVQRCLMGLEPDAIANVERDPNWNQWQWMKNYRVWEANRKVFLYPENWYDVTLTDDKTYLLSEFIDELQQNELTNDNAEEALKKYLEKLDGIAFLEVMATWYDAINKNMHVFARTKGGDPSIYYYRRFEKERYWTPWGKVELDITGDHLLAFIRNSRLCLAWPIFSEEADPNQGAKLPDQTNPNEQAVDRPRKKLKIQLAISEYTIKKWQPKKVSKDGIKTPNDDAETPYTTDLIPRERVRFFYNQLFDQIIVVNEQSTLVQGLEFRDYQMVNVISGAFDIAGCKGYPELAFPKPFTFDFIPKFRDTELLNQRYREMDSIAPNDLSASNVYALQSGSDFIEILNKTPGIFRITYPHQFTLIDRPALIYQLFQLIIHSGKTRNKNKKNSFKVPIGTLLPYFFEDSNHAYVIIPGFYKKEVDSNGQLVSFTDAEKRTASNVFQLFEEIINWYNKILHAFRENPPENRDAAIQFIIADTSFQNILEELTKYTDFDAVLHLLIGRTGSAKFDEFLKNIIAGKSLVYGEQFKNLYHPMICALRSILYKDGIPALMKRDTQLLKTNFDFTNYYHPNNQIVPQTFNRNPNGTKTMSFPIEDVDFTSDGSYSAYNWDLFFRVPLHIAASLTKNQRFEEALTWFHYIFNPTGALPGTGVQKYWVTKPFYLNQETDYVNQRIDSLLYSVAGQSTPDIKELEFAIEEWRNKPFRPDVVARFRPVAYQKALLMKYIDNLTEWGDYLFRQDTMESIAQATQLYILADKLLGPKPKIIPAAIKQPYETYNQIEAKLDSFGNALIELENILPDLAVLPEDGAELPPSPVTLALLYFCVPANEKMFEYWDRVADRLFKIRHCQNMDGVERSLALFAPPIDPAILVRATAAGLDMSSVMAGENAPAPYYRFNVLSQKATELAQEVRGLGASLLAALEKKDAESMALLRSEMEMTVLDAMMTLKEKQFSEANEQIEILMLTKEVINERKNYYKNIEKIISKEQLSLVLLESAQSEQVSAQMTNNLASLLGYLPNITIGVAGVGGSPEVNVQWGTGNIISALQAVAGSHNLMASMMTYQANRSATLASYDRRFDEWKLQECLAVKELASIDKQIAAAEIRKDITGADLANHKIQIINAKKTDDFMRSKFTNKELYEWMIGQISSVYFKSYQLAYDLAKKAERCYQFELGVDDTFISFGYWDSMKKGLQSADHLIYDNKRMEASYIDKGKREYEITKHVSVAMLDPLSLIRLRATGVCDFEIPEVVYDMDHPGQYFRRLKSVSVSLPCIAGPYTSVSAKLSLVNNRYRKNANPDNAAATGYAEDPGNDERFVYKIGAIQSIATSNAQNDSGVFELNFRDERYLPFENTGAISSWRLELPTEIKQFDYNTVSDVIVHVKYTAREGGSGLKTAANAVLRNQLEAIKQGLHQTGLHVALNMKHDLPNEWHLLKTNGTVDLTIDTSRLPYMVQSFHTVEIESVIFVAKIEDDPATFTINVDGVATHLSRVNELKLCRGINLDINLGAPPFILSVSNADKSKLEDLLMIVKYRF